MLQHDILKQLFAASDDVSDRIIQSTPSTPAEKQALDHLMNRRDKLNLRDRRYFVLLLSVIHL